MTESATVIERGARAIARQVPVDSGAWLDGHGHDFPREYSDREADRIRAIARAAIEAMGDSAAEMVWVYIAVDELRKVLSVMMHDHRDMIDAALSEESE